MYPSFLLLPHSIPVEAEHILCAMYPTMWYNRTLCPSYLEPQSQIPINFWRYMVAQYWILLDDSDWEIQFSDSQRNGFGQEQWFSISNSPRGALSFCSSLSLHLVDSIVLFSEQWNGLSSSSVLSGVFVLWNKWTDGSQTSNGSWRLEVCVSLWAFACMHENLCVCVHFCVWCAHACCRCVHLCVLYSCMCVCMCVCLHLGQCSRNFSILILG